MLIFISIVVGSEKVDIPPTKELEPVFHPLNPSPGLGTLGTVPKSDKKNWRERLGRLCCSCCCSKYEESLTVVQASISDNESNAESIVEEVKADTHLNLPSPENTIQADPTLMITGASLPNIPTTTYDMPAPPTHTRHSLSSQQHTNEPRTPLSNGSRTAHYQDCPWHPGSPGDPNNRTSSISSEVKVFC